MEAKPHQDQVSSGERQKEIIRSRSTVKVAKDMDTMEG